MKAAEGASSGGGYSVVKRAGDTSSSSKQRIEREGKDQGNFLGVIWAAFSGEIEENCR